MTTDERGEWIEVSRSHSIEQARSVAREHLGEAGVNIDTLESELLRLDVGLDQHHNTYYRVRVRRAVLAE